MSIFERLFGRRRAETRKLHAATIEAIARETPEQKMRFNLEVAAQLGNESADALLAKMGPDPEKRNPN